MLHHNLIHLGKTKCSNHTNKYATIKIPKIDVDLPVYYGDSLDVLKKGVGHSSGSYFPGEGGSIIYMGHNSKKMFYLGIFRVI